MVLPQRWNDSTFQSLSIGVTQCWLLLRTYAPNSLSLLTFAFSSDNQSLQVAASPCWSWVFPNVISEILSLNAWILIPVVFMMHLTVSSHESSAFPDSGTGRLATIFLATISARGSLRDCNHFLMFRPSVLFAVQIVPTSKIYISSAATTFSFEQNVIRHLFTHRIY